MKNTILALTSALALTFVAAPAFATEYYVVMDSTAKKCMVMDTMPTAGHMSLVDSGTSSTGNKSYQSKSDAEAAMGKAVVCKSM